MSNKTGQRKCTVDSISAIEKRVPHIPSELSLLSSPPTDINENVGPERIRQAILRHCKRSHDQLVACGLIS